MWKGSNISRIKVESDLLIDVNKSLQSWLDGDKIIVNAMFPENFRCVLSGPSECGKTFLLKYLFLISIQFDNYTSLVLLVINMMI